MLETVLAPGHLASRLEVSIGMAADLAGDEAVIAATTDATGRMAGGVADLVLVVTAGAPPRDAVAAVRAVAGHVDVAGGVATALLTDRGAVSCGALVVCIANAEGAASGVAATAGPDLRHAGQAAARLVLAGWPFRARYPRGIALAFAREGIDDTGQSFLESWRAFMGPKMRTVCTVLGSSTVHGHAGVDPVASVACVEAPYATGIGYTDAASPDGTALSTEGLIHGAADAMSTALERLEGRPPRLVLVLESASRYRALGAAAGEEWAAMRQQMDERTACVGWLAPHVSGYGRGVQPSDAAGTLIAVAIGDAPRN